MIRRGLISALASLALTLTGASAQSSDAPPLSAIEWLQRELEAPTPPPDDSPATLLRDETDARLPQSHFEAIESAPLERTAAESVGLFTAERVGLPRDLWGSATVSEVIDGIAALPPDTLPSAKRLTLRLLQAELAPPREEGPDGRDALLLARVDKLVEFGALEQAGQLLQAVSGPNAALNARAFDIALLLGEEDRACAAMRGHIGSEHGQAAQIFCMARRGDWQVAHSSLRVAQGLQLIDDTEALLLTRFLEEEEEEYPLPPPQQTTPLGWRIMEALGDPVTTAGLPIAYAHADLRGTSGWRAQLDAAERLTRAGVMQPNRLHGLYLSRRAAASGGLWDRVRVIQALERATETRDAAAASAALEQAWPLFAAAELELALAEMVAEELMGLSFTSNAREILWKLAMLSEHTRESAADLAPESTVARIASALAEGRDIEAIARAPMAMAIQAGFAAEPYPESVQALLEAGKPGMVLLDALARIAEAASGDLNAASAGLIRLRAIGLDPVARQIAIELLLLERRG